MQIIIENIGRGLATDVSFEASRPIPNNAFGICEVEIKPAEPMDAGPLIDGIPSLGPGDSRKLIWGQYWGLKQALGDQPLTVTCKYKHGKRSMPPFAAVLDVNSFTGTDAVGSEGERTINELKRVADALEQIANSKKQFGE